MVVEGLTILLELLWAQSLHYNHAHLKTKLGTIFDVFLSYLSFILFSFQKMLPFVAFAFVPGIISLSILLRSDPFEPPKAAEALIRRSKLK